MQTKLAWAFGITLTLIGILGFVPAIVTSNGLLLGFFEVDGMHNLIHIATGVIALIVVKMNARVGLYFKVFGVVYAVVAVAGFLQGDNVLGLIGVNMLDNVLHVGIALVALYAGFGIKEDMPLAASATSAHAM